MIIRLLRLLIHKPAYKARVMLSAEVFDASGKLVKRLKPRPANTLLQIWYKTLFANCSFSNVVGVTDTGGTSRTLTAANEGLRIDAGAGATTAGMVIGTGTNAVTLADTKLQTQVSTNIAHGAQAFSLNAPDASHYQFIVQRTFTNNTGSTLNIKEVGLYIHESNTGFVFCGDRTLVNISVLNGGATTITYTWQTSV